MKDKMDLDHAIIVSGALDLVNKGITEGVIIGYQPFGIPVVTEHEGELIYTQMMVQPR